MNTNYSTGNNIKKKLAWLILFLPFILSAVKQTLERTLETPIDILNSFGFSLENENLLFLFFSNSFIKLFFIFLILFGITFFETTLINQTRLEKIRSLSLSKLRFSKGYKFADIWYFCNFLLLGQFPFLVTLATLGGSNLTNGIEKSFHNFYSANIPMPNSSFTGVILVILSILLADFSVYLRHRMEHGLGFLWDIHEFHHSATEMTILSKLRESPLDNIFTKPLLLPITVLSALLINENLSQGFSLPFYIYLFFNTIFMVNDFIAHSSLKILYPKPLSYIFMSPAHHWLHHSSHPKHYNCNFSVGFIFWDKIFGTYMDESHLKDIPGYGVYNSQYNKHHPLYSFNILPLVKIFKRFNRILFLK
tara:strand:- start:685 stop:1776 length:1092 start_codon:yes stop_codon:yes gene_type:complete